MTHISTAHRWLSTIATLCLFNVSVIANEPAPEGFSSLFDGKTQPLAEDVPFQLTGTIAILPDGSASIRIGSPGDPAVD